MAELHVETVGHGTPALLLLHGLGVNGAVWKPLVAELKTWPGRIVIPDFRGHGRSPHARPYAIGRHAADVAGLFAPGETVHVVGHSMGGMVGLALASNWFGIQVERVLGLDLKVSWTSDEFTKLRQVAAAPVRWFDSRAEAAERFLRVSGLVGLVDAAAAVVDAGIVAEGGRFRLAADPATVEVVGPELAPVLASIRGRWRLACGSRDPMVAIAELRGYDREAIEIDGSGHNPHVDAPAAVAGLIGRP